MMKIAFLKGPVFAVAAALVAGACVHTPPGTSVEIALARKPELVRLPQPPPPPPEMIAVMEPQEPLPAPEPALADMNDRLEAVADAYTQGKFAMDENKDREAIAAFEETVKLDPGHVEAWQNLAVLYERVGDQKKALIAFRNAKRIARH